MSQTSSTPGREAQLQPSNPRIYRAMSEEIDWLTTKLERAHSREARIREDSEAHRESAQQWQTRAEEAERELSRIQCKFPEFNIAWRAMGQAFANVTSQVIDDNDDVTLLPGDTQDIHMADDESAPVFDSSPRRRSNRGSENSEPLLPNAPNTFSRLGSDVQRGSSLRGSSLSGIPDRRRGHEPGLQTREGPSSQRPSPPPPNPTHPRQPPPHQPSLAETIGPRDRHAAPSHIAGERTNVISRPEHHTDIHEGLPAVGETSRLMEGHSLEIHEGQSQIPGIQNVFTAPAIPTRHTPIPLIHRGPWDLYGPVIRPVTMAEKTAGWSDEEEPDTSDQPEE